MSRDQTDWQPIETAPRDEVVDLWSTTRSRYVSAFWSASHGRWLCGSGQYEDQFFTHWRRLYDPQGNVVGK